MKQSKAKSAPEPQTDSLATDPAAATATKPTSVVDDVFDAVTAWAAQGLTVAKRSLEASARWLDGRAKVVGELASKLSSTTRPAA